jgi:CRP/FNR family transcriptional regulator
VSISYLSTAREQALDPERCQHCAVRHQAVCGALAPEELLDLNRMARRKIFKAGQSILIAEENASYVGNIVTGVIKLIQSLPDGRQQIVGLQFPPDFLGRTYGAESRCFAEAVCDVDLCLFPKKEFERLLENYPGLEKRLFQDTLEELDVARDWMLLLGRKTAAEKVASFLLLIARRAPLLGCRHAASPDQISFQLPMTRADIADFLGLTIETVSRQMTKLKTQEIIRLHDNREMSILDMERLNMVGGLS